MLLVVAFAAACPAGGVGRQGGGLLPVAPGAAQLVRAETLVRLDGPALPLEAALDGATATATALDAYAAVDDFAAGFRWAPADDDDPAWRPQGLTGGFEAGGAPNLLLSVSYARDGEAAEGSGARVTVVDLDTLAYAPVLLVDASGDEPAPVPVHAGGLAWVGRELYVADTTRGVRVFDLDGLRAADPATAAGAAYVLPQVALATVDGCDLRFSFLSVDAAAGELLSGTFSDDDPDTPLVAWPLDGDGRLGATTPASAAWIAQQSDLQGVARDGDDWWLSASLQDGRNGALYAASGEGVPEASPWPHAPEDLAYDPATDRLWSQTEIEGERVVFAVTPPRAGCDVAAGPPALGLTLAAVGWAARRRRRRG